MTAIRKLTACSVLALAAVTAAWALPPRQPPAPPVAEQASVKSIYGNLVLLAIKLPTTYGSGDPIPGGTPVKIRFFQSRDGGKSYALPVRIVAGSSGKVGDGVHNVWVEVEGDLDRAPVFLAASAEVQEVASALTTRHLTFIAKPKLTIYATPGEAPGAAAPAPPQPAGPAGEWQLEPGGSILTIRVDGQRFTGVIRGDNQDLICLRGACAGAEYTFEWWVPPSGESLRGTGKLAVAEDGRSLTGHIQFDGQSKSHPFELAIEGRTLKANPRSSR